MRMRMRMRMRMSSPHTLWKHTQTYVTLFRATSLVHSFICLSVCPFVFYVCLFLLRLFVCLFDRLFVCTFFVCLFVVCLVALLFIFVGSFFRLFVCSFVCLHVCMFVCLFVCMFFCAFVCLFLDTFLFTLRSRTFSLFVQKLFRSIFNVVIPKRILYF